MKERILALLKQCSRLKGMNDLRPITEGASGAFVYSLQGAYIVKYVYVPEVDSLVVKRCKNEYNFYKYFSNKNIDFIPELVFQISTDTERLIVLKQYSPIQQSEWNDHLIDQSMEICARINALDTREYMEAYTANEEGHDDAYPLSVSYDNWVKLHYKFPHHISMPVLNDMYERYNQIVQYNKELAIPSTLCHGDFHPNNCLLDGDQLLVCDWQNVNVGRGIGDVSFFASRGKDMGLKLNQDRLIEKYYEALPQSTKRRIDVKDIHKCLGADEFLVSFRFWAQYLQTSDLDRVLNIYNSMVKNFYLLLS